MPVTQDIVNFLKNNLWSGFYSSLLSQYEKNGFLSEKQIAAVEKAILAKSMPKTATERVFSIQPAQRIEIKAWIARRLQADLNLSFFFRNLEVAEILSESHKAYHVKVKFVSQIVTSCHICDKELDTDISRATGIGPVCAKKMGLPRPSLETADQTLRSIDALCAQIGVVGPIWIPKSQIKLNGGGI